VQATDRNIQELKNSNQELKNAAMANSRDIQELKSSVARIEGQINHLVTELNRIEEEELQSQLIIEKHYMSDEDKSENFYHEHVQVTTTLDEDEVVDKEEEQVEHNERIEHHEKSQPPTNPNLPNDMEAIIEALACIIAPLETHKEHKVSSLVHLQEPSYVKILKDLCTQAQKSRNHFPRKIL
jgi:chromosome segregation ATPase